MQTDDEQQPQDAERKWVILSVAVTPEMAEQIRGYAKSSGRTVSTELRFMAEMFLDSRAEAEAEADEADPLTRVGE